MVDVIFKNRRDATQFSTAVVTSVKNELWIIFLLHVVEKVFLLNLGNIVQFLSSWPP